jgi:hypothetical protein
MLIATRSLKLSNSDGDVDVPVRLFAPVQQSDGAWSCTYEIDWPNGKATSVGFGFDAFQALILTLQKIGGDLYASNSHKSGELVWEKQGSGYGFPVSNIIRDLLVGDDAKYL